MEFCLLGPLTVRVDGMAMRVAAAKQRVVLAALLLNADRVMALDELSEAVWGPAPPASARVTLQNYVKRLRRALAETGGNRIGTQPDGYVISVATGELDVNVFETLQDTARQAARDGRWDQAAARLREALALWRGQPLADIPSDLLSLQHVPRLAELHTQALEARVQADLQLGRHSEVISELRRFTAANPLRERPYALLMLALYREGRQAEALATYQQARQTLASELGVEPGPDLRELQQRILSADPALSVTAHSQPNVRVAEPAMATAASNGHGGTDAQVLPPPLAPEEPLAPGEPCVTPGRFGSRPVLVPRQLPAGIANFAGRTAELANLMRLLDTTAAAPTAAAAPASGARGGMVVISAIGGTAGVGKTALALHFAHQVADRFPDGQLYLNLRGFDSSGSPLAAEDAIRSFLDALQVPPDQIPSGLAAQSGLYRSLVADRRMLVVLDNAAAAAQVRPLLPGGGGCLVLVTSRRQLTALAAAEGAHPITLDVLTNAEARELLARRLGSDRLAAEPAAVDELTVLCARLPLALGITAARAAVRPSFPLAALAAELRDTRCRLDALDGGEAAADVRAVFSWSCQQLSPAAARMFRLLGSHPGPDITAHAAASLAGISLDQARRALAELTAACLLAEHTPGRYSCHDLLRAYAAEQAGAIDEEGEPQAAIHRAVDHYLHTAIGADRLLYPARTPITAAPPQRGTRPEQDLTTHAQALAWFDAEHQVLLAAVNVAAARGLDACAWQLPLAMETFFYRRGHWHDWAATQQTALAAARRLGDAGGQAYAHRGLASASIELGSYDEAERHLGEAFRLREHTGDLAGRARLHLDMARMRNRQSRDAEALRHAQLALNMFRPARHRAGEGDALSEVGWDFCLLGDYEAGIASCEQALEVADEIGSQHNTGCTWDTLGYAHRHPGHHAKAAACYRRSAEILNHQGHRCSMAVTLTYAGDAYHAAGDDAAARDAWQQALAIFDELRPSDAAKIRAKLRGLDATAALTS